MKSRLIYSIVLCAIALSQVAQAQDAAVKSVAQHSIQDRKIQEHALTPANAVQTFAKAYQTFQSRIEAGEIVLVVIGKTLYVLANQVKTSRNQSVSTEAAGK